MQASDKDLEHMTVAELSQELEYHLGNYLVLEKEFDRLGPDTLRAWQFHYEYTLEYATVAHGAFGETGGERALLRRSKDIWPTEKQRAHMRQPPIEGLSPAFAHLNVARNVSMERVVDVAILLNAANGDDDLLDDAYRYAFHRFVRVGKAIERSVPVTGGDRELRRRSIGDPPAWVWERRGIWEREQGMASGPRRKHRYRAGHVLDPHRLTWG